MIDPSGGFSLFRDVGADAYRIALGRAAAGGGALLGEVDDGVGARACGRSLQ
ncbi:MAG: hypothetical protein MI923_22295 [Phycisphaerales bacterium]|nr:hypothetical protein [Phycisphaerales bacterium]